MEVFEGGRYIKAHQGTDAGPTLDQPKQVFLTSKFDKLQNTFSVAMYIVIGVTTPVANGM